MMFTYICCLCGLFLSTIVTGKGRLKFSVWYFKFSVPFIVVSFCSGETWSTISSSCVSQNDDHFVHIHLSSSEFISSSACGVETSTSTSGFCISYEEPNNDLMNFAHRVLFRRTQAWEAEYCMGVVNTWLVLRLAWPCTAGGTGNKSTVTFCWGWRCVLLGCPTVIEAWLLINVWVGALLL